MNKYDFFNTKSLQTQLNENYRNSLTALYYLLQKQTLREGNKTILDLQAYLESCQKYKN
jgi:hypothetical protein